MIHLTTHTQFKQLTPVPYIVWFSAAWCGPCQRMEKRMLEETVTECNIPFYYCDQTVNPETIDAVGIKQFPTFVLFRDGEEVARRSTADTAKVCSWIRKTF
jgi:thiol-disulfide isomerase/thioredoxin